MAFCFLGVIVIPTKLATACRVPYCPELVTGGGYCPKHLKVLRKQQDENRPNSAQRGYGGRWQRYRAIYLKEHPLCVECYKKGDITPASEIDHIQPISHKNDPLFWNPTNHQALCKSCHSRKTMKERAL